jgi:hypothetical protein
MIARLVAVDDDIGSHRERVLVCAAPEKRVRTSTLHHPDFLRAVLLGNLHVNPGVWIDPFDFRNLAFEQDRSVSVEFRPERVMSRRRVHRHQYADHCHRAAEN